MKTRLVPALAIALFALAAASRVEAQPGYCGTECSRLPPQVPCSLECLVCPGTCIEYEWGCDCAFWSTCGVNYSNACYNSELVGPDWLDLSALTAPETSVAPDRELLISPIRQGSEPADRKRRR